ncbi:GNAT family N-acetyltransferase [Alkalihalobacillus pseudalcaliphilus]|uniref:GNAT family N-acetyltransferase n=1 Tax=Alkalihalobacillus pseudalcaliphilus TaxID=79884 RepID=UPI00064DFDAC|nr:GNAT family protein [Alkalihalobacillus pseudalcaliphilus]KMK75847.1 alanine acetyltransferase [Alkalihalobacillus pseudalcaliphilus]
MFTLQVNNDITIELIQQHQKEELYQLIDQNREHLRKWLLWVDKRQSAEDMGPIIKLWLYRYAENNGFDAGIRYQGRLVGMIALHEIDWKNRSTSIGYFLSEKEQGKGIITHAVGTLLTYVFGELALNRVEIQTAASNKRSCSIPEKIGFSLEGRKREAQWLYDHYEDILTYSMLTTDWQEKYE